MKKFVAMMMTLAMVLALAVPVLATAPTATPISSTASSAGARSGGGYVASYGGATNVPVLNVEVSFEGGDAKGLLVLNPYQLKVTTATNGAAISSAAIPKKVGNGNGTTAQVIASPVKIENKSTTAVEAIVTGAKATSTQSTSADGKTTTNDIALASKHTEYSTTKLSKGREAYIVILGKKDGGGAILTHDEIPGVKDVKFDKTQHVLPTTSTSGSAAVKVLDLAAGTGSAVATSGEGTGYIHITGTLAGHLALDADPWTQANKLDVTYSLKIRPAIVAPTGSGS